MADLTLAVKAEDKASPVLEDVADAAKEVGKSTEKAGQQTAKAGESIGTSMLKAQLAFEVASKAVAVFTDALKAGFQGLVEAEQADLRLSGALTQLGYNAQELLPALKAQADAMEETTLVSAEAVQEVQGLLVRFGTAPRDIDRTTRAVLDYAAATGQDAVSAARALAQGAENGGKGLKGLGIAITDTGDATKNLGAAVGELEKRFGGAAEAAGGGLGGSLARLQQQQDKLNEAVAGFMADTATSFLNWLTNSKMGLDALSEAMKGLNTLLNGPENQATLGRTNELIALQEERIELVKKEKEAVNLLNRAYEYGWEDRIQYGLQLESIQGRILAIDEKIAGVKTRQRQAGAITTGASAQARAAGRGGGGDAGAAASKQGGPKVLDDGGLLFEGIREENEAEQELARRLDAQDAAEAKANEEAFSAGTKAIAAYMKGQLEAFSRGQDELQKRMKQAADEMAQQNAAWEQAGLALGGAFAGALEQQIRNLGSGGEFDLGDTVAALLPTIVQAVATAIGGPAAGAIAGQLTGVFGALVGLGGGGGGGTTVVQAFDARSIQDRLGSDIGSAHRRVINQNRGELAQTYRNRGW